MTHLERLIAEFLDWQGFIVKTNLKVGRLSHGGWAMELDVLGYHPKKNIVIQYEPSIDAHSWETREKRYQKKFDAGREYIFKEVFPWLPETTPLEQIAVFISHPKGKDKIGGGLVVSVDELMKDIRAEVMRTGAMGKNAISENYPLLRTIQLTHMGYHKALV